MEDEGLPYPGCFLGGSTDTGASVCGAPSVRKNYAIPSAFGAYVKYMKEEIV